MRSTMAKRWIYFAGAIMVSLALAWFGAVFLSISGEAFSRPVLLIFGLLAISAGICLLTLGNLKQDWPGGVLVTLVGFYGCARAAGTIAQPWLARVAGVVCWVAALVLLYMGRPGRKQPTADSTTAKR